MSRAEKRAKRIVGPPPKKPGPLERAVHGDFEYRSEVRRYKNRLYDQTSIEKKKTRRQIKNDEKRRGEKSAKSGCLSAILPPIILAFRLLPGLPELKLPEPPAEIAPIVTEAGSLTVAASTAEPVANSEPQA